MSLLEQQNFLAKVFTDEHLREKFLSEPENVGRENNLSETEIEQIRQLLPEQIKFFADSLFYKRLHEVEKFLPLTRKVVGKKFEFHFREFANEFLPNTIKKHLEDAGKFCEYLQKKETAWERDLISFEQARLIFNGYGKSFMFRKFSFDIKEVLKVSRQDAKLRNVRKRISFAVWLRLGNKIYHYIWWREAFGSRYRFGQNIYKPNRYFLPTALSYFHFGLMVCRASATRIDVALV